MAPPRRSGRVSWIAALAFAAGAGVALMSGRIVALSDSPLGELLGAEQQALPKPPPALGRPAAGSASETPAAGSASETPAVDRASETPAVRQPDSLTTVAGTRASTNVEIVHRSLPALDEVRSELKRLAPTLRRCVRSPALGLDVDFSIDGVTGRVRQLDVRAPALTPGRLECVKEGLSDLQVAPFVSSELTYRHRYAW
jgi:hypothetical protein